MSDASGTARDAARPSDDGGSVVALPRRGAPAALDNLPLELSSFVGRAREMAEVRRLLAANRLLTLTGPGGSGKTRLALAAAADRSGRFGEGVWLVELAPLSNPEAVEYALEGPDAPEGIEASLAYPAGLSAREVEVLRLVAQGMTNPQVGERLYLSHRTVGQHLRSVYRKLGVSSRAAAAREAFERGLI